jgi:hypothetical protein
MKLLTELVEHVSYLVEGEGDNRKHFLEGIFMQAAVPNRNKRIYPTDVLAKESTRYMSEHVTKNRAYGELGHPAGPNINLDRVAIHIKNLTQEGNNFKGRALIASTPMGNIVKGLVEDGANLGVSTRALGSLKPIQENLSEVQDDLRLLAIDVVADPSAPDAYVNAIQEGAEWVFNPVTGTWSEQVVESHKTFIKRATMDEVERNKLSLFEDFLAEVAGKTPRKR